MKGGTVCIKLCIKCAIEGWDGSYKGKVLRSAVFIYVVTVKYITGEEQIIKGNVTLMH